MTTRKYSSRSQQTTLTGALTSSGTSATVVSGTALLGGVTITAGETFTVVIDPDTALEEIVDVTAVSTNTLTITRGIDGSTGQAHSAGAVVRHMAIGRDYREANTHIEATTGHGATGAVVGTTNTQTLTNKTLTTPTITSPTITGTGSIAGTFTGNLTGNVTGTVSGNAGTVTNGVYTTDTGTVTSTMILNGTIVDADINASAAIAKTKLALTGTITSTDIANDTIVDADINTAAAITKTKISGTAVTLADTGTVTSTMIADGTIVNADINASAAIDWTKLAVSSTVSSTELGYVDGVTSAIQTQLDSKLATATASSTYAPLASPALTGTPTAPTATAGTNTTQVATTAFVGTAVSNLVASAPSTLDTLNELATALGNDAAFSTTVTNSIATKLPLAGGTMSGAIAMGTNKITGLGTPTVSTDASTKAYADTMLPLAGGTMSGAIAMGTNKITGLGTPTATTDAATKNYVDTVTVAPSNLTGPITSVGAATAIASQTGTGTKFVVDTSPTLVTPALGVATATSINGTTIPSTKTLVVTTDKLSALAATSSSEVAGIISDETGSGSLVFGTSPTLSNPAINNFVLGYSTTATAAGTTTLTNSSNNQQLFTGTTTQTVVMPVSTTMTVGTRYVIENNSTGVVTVQSSGLNTIATIPAGTSIKITSVLNTGTTAASWDFEYVGFGALTGTGSAVLATSPTITTPTISSIVNTGTLTLPTSTDTLVGRATTDTLTNKTLTTPVISSISNSGTVTIPTGTVTLATLTGTETLTNKTLTSPVINTPKVYIGYSAKTAAYTVASGDEGYLFSMNNAATQQFNIPTDATFNFAIGTEIHFVWITGAGQPTIGATTPGTTTVLSAAAVVATPKLRVANSAATAIKLAANSWLVVGDIA